MSGTDPICFLDIFNLQLVESTNMAPKDVEGQCIHWLCGYWCILQHAAHQDAQEVTPHLPSQAEEKGASWEPRGQLCPCRMVLLRSQVSLQSLTFRKRAKLRKGDQTLFLSVCVLSPVALTASCSKTQSCFLAGGREECIGTQRQDAVGHLQWEQETG